MLKYCIVIPLLSYLLIKSRLLVSLLLLFYRFCFRFRIHTIVERLTLHTDTRRIYAEYRMIHQRIIPGIYILKIKILFNFTVFVPSAVILVLCITTKSFLIIYRFSFLYCVTPVTVLSGIPIVAIIVVEVEPENVPETVTVPFPEVNVHPLAMDDLGDTYAEPSWISL